MKVKQLSSRGKSISLEKPILAGVLNMTPDSFSKDGLSNTEDAVERAREMVREGVEWIDIGGESSGPGSSEVSPEEELKRVIPVIESIRKESDVWISIDTWKAEVARRALDAGANVVNDVTALRGDSAMVQFLAESQIPVVLMYSKDRDARTTTTEVTYGDIVESVKSFLKERVDWIRRYGIPIERVILDPGMGFFVSGKPEYSFDIIRRLKEFSDLGCPIMISPSRKSFLARVSPGKNLSVHERELPTMVSAAIAVWEGASIIRLHDFIAGRLMLDTVHALKKGASLEDAT